MSNLSRPASGHWYFSLKDKKAQIRCAFFKGRNRLLTFSPEDGQLVLVRGRISLYEARGDFQLIIDHMEPAGQGDLQRAYEDSKQRLSEQGYFDADHKQELPLIPKQIGLITSPSGAAIKDVLHVLKRRYPLASIVIYPTPVQGETAAAEIIKALTLAVARKECDVLLITRGGGSLEDLWCFNDEKLAKAIFDCPIPIISGVGHEIDTTITDFVADVRAPTPSAAAEMLVPDHADITQSLTQFRRRLKNHIQTTLQSAAQNLDWYTKHIQQFHPGKQLVAQRQHLAGLARQLGNGINNQLKLSRYRLDNSAHALNTVSPLATLSRGYSISRRVDSAQPIKQASEMIAGDMMSTRLANGTIISRVESADE